VVDFPGLVSRVDSGMFDRQQIEEKNEIVPPDGGTRSFFLPSKDHTWTEGRTRHVISEK